MPDELKERLGMDLSPAGIPSRRLWWRIAAVVLPFVVVAGGFLLIRNGQERIVNITVSNGERKEIILPDKSTVVLNAGSSLEYPEKFAKNARRVKLSGEAWFAVNKDASKPFKVDAGELSVEVPGTEFNLKAYPKEIEIIATLERGSIKVETKSDRFFTLKAGQKLSYNSKLNSVEVVEVNAGDYSAWREGCLIFENMPLKEIFSTIERTFDVTINPDNDVDVEKLYSVKFLHHEILSEVMEILGVTCGFTSITEGKTIHISINTSPRIARINTERMRVMSPSHRGTKQSCNLSTT
jgi:ferric-dicitrate binding protein FerR (iron transport regulator)